MGLPGAMEVFSESNSVPIYRRSPKVNRSLTTVLQSGRFVGPISNSPMCATARYRLTKLPRHRTVRMDWTSEAVPQRRHPLQPLFAHFLQRLKVAHHHRFTPRADNPLPFPFREQPADGEEGGAG